MTTLDSLHLLVREKLSIATVDLQWSVFLPNFTYKSDRLSWPRSHDSDCDGNIYIVGHWSKNIHQLTSDGKCIRIIPLSDFSTITDSPWVLQFKENNNRFMLTPYDIFKVLVCEID
jgi:hypothetical protein